MGEPIWTFPVDAIGIDMKLGHGISLTRPSVADGMWDVWDSSRCRQGARLIGSHDSLDDALAQARPIVAERRAKPTTKPQWNG